MDSQSGKQTVRKTDGENRQADGASAASAVHIHKHRGPVSGPITHSHTQTFLSRLLERWR